MANSMYLNVLCTLVVVSLHEFSYGTPDDAVDVDIISPFTIKKAGDSIIEQKKVYNEILEVSEISELMGKKSLKDFDNAFNNLVPYLKDSSLKSYISTVQKYVDDQIEVRDSISSLLQNILAYTSKAKKEYSQSTKYNGKLKKDFERHAVQPKVIVSGAKKSVSMILNSHDRLKEMLEYLKEYNKQMNGPVKKLEHATSRLVAYRYLLEVLSKSAEAHILSMKSSIEAMESSDRIVFDHNEVESITTKALVSLDEAKFKGFFKIDLNAINELYEKCASYRDTMKNLKETSINNAKDIKKSLSEVKKLLDKVNELGLYVAKKPEQGYSKVMETYNKLKELKDQIETKYKWNYASKQSSFTIVAEVRELYDDIQRILKNGSYRIQVTNTRKEPTIDNSTAPRIVNVHYKVPKGYEYIDGELVKLPTYEEATSGDGMDDRLYPALPSKASAPEEYGIELTPPKVAPRYKLPQSKSHHDEEHPSTEGFEDRSPPEVTTTVPLDSTVGPADSSSNYLSLKGNATPGDRGEDGGVDGSGMNNSTGPQVEPVADLREAEGEVNKESLHGEWKTSTVEEKDGTEDGKNDDDNTSDTDVKGKKKKDKKKKRGLFGKFKDALTSKYDQILTKPTKTLATDSTEAKTEDSSHGGDVKTTPLGVVSDLPGEIMKAGGILLGDASSEVARLIMISAQFKEQFDKVKHVISLKLANSGNIDLMAMILTFINSQLVDVCGRIIASAEAEQISGTSV